MNLRIFVIGLGLLAPTVACDKLGEGDGKATVTAASAAPAADPAPPAPTQTTTIVATPTATVTVQAAAGKPGSSATTTVINGNRAIRVQNGPTGSVTDFAGPHGSGTVQVAPNGVKVQGPNGTVVVPPMVGGAVPGMPTAGQ